MANKTVPQQQGNTNLTATLQPIADERELTQGLTLDDADALNTAAGKLEALLAHVYGDESGHAFRSLSDGIQDAYLQTCSDLASEIKQIAKRIARFEGAGVR